jgi:tryptophan synthase alpha chain
MLSYNLILSYGVEKFYQDIVRAKVDGTIVPDLPPEESKFSNVFLVAPTSTNTRIRLIAEKSSGFIYLISVAGITGTRSEIAGNLSEIIARVRDYSKLPVAVGFGVSTPKQAAEITKVADGVIVGSAIVNLIAKGKISAAPKFVKALRSAIDAR